jgi:DNA-binding CsgD family transcriptional regulator/putative methionine-R-sulfoxide reductase with GAF domain
MKPVLDRVIRSAMSLANGDAGSIMLLTQDGDELVVVAAVGPRAHVIMGARQPASASVAGRALQTDDLLVLKGRLSASGAIASEHPQNTAGSLVVPMRVAGRLVGVLNVNAIQDQADLSADTQSLIRLLANQATLVIENARLYEDLARKERRLELFVDKFLRLQADQRAKSDSAAEPRLRQLLSDVMRETVQQYVSELHHDRDLETASESHCEKLTDREREVLALIVEGLINKEIGRRLGVSPNTVKNHIASITQKLGVADRTQAAVIAIRQGLLG